VNPVIYNHTSKDFRDAFRGAFSSAKRDSSSRAVSGLGRSALGQQRSMKALDAANDAGVMQANLNDLEQQQQQQQDCANDADNLSDSSDRVHLEG